MASIRIISLANDGYYSYLRALVASAAVNFSIAKMHVVLVNVSKKKKLTLQSMHPNIIVDSETVDFTHMSEGCYCARRRAHLFQRIRKVTSDTLMWIDADSIIRKDCNHLNEELASFDLATVRKKRTGTLRSGIIAVGNSKASRNFINRYEKSLITDHRWMADQIHLNRIYHDMEKELKFRPLSSWYCDVWMRPLGSIWTAKSKKKHSRKYLQEAEKYTKCHKGK